MLNGQEPNMNGLSLEANDRLNAYFSLDSERQAFMRTILQRIEADQQRISDLELDLEDQKKSRASYQAQSINLDNELQRQRQKVSKGSFVVVLIDGDGAKFREEYLRDTIGGAEKAALKLKQAVRDNFRGTSLGHDDIPILVRVYANLNDLSKSLRMSHVIDYDDDMRLFAEKFTNTRADFDFINVGKGKENADAKMRRMLSHYQNNIQCKKIFLAGCCHDNGYLHDLRDYAGIADNIVLIETTPAESGFRSLQFPILRFDEVFRSEPLNNETKRVVQTMPIRSYSPPQSTPGPIARPIHFVQKPPPGFSPIYPEQATPVMKTMMPTPASPGQTNSTVGRQPQLSPQPASQPTPQPQGPARTPSVISSGNGGTSISYATAGGAVDHRNVTVKTSKPKKQSKAIFYNDDQHRVDTQISHPPRTQAQTSYQAKFQTIKPSVFCNDHYLKGSCQWANKCDKTHDVELTSAELAIHRYKARTSLCPAGPWCVDYGCYLSHHCPREHCTRGDMCPFSYTDRYGDLHYSKEQLQPATKWTEGVDIPEHV
ncbi:Uu.00g127410.m01.CDS01 [Anthostomella pinea]|uniref:Uu.00g127410.m01.CDS01 n=1 Tax=Anthostomella pinea TaxID=933095 RepID=A0AAI8VCT9_9PEZI|nr:Uu.00g127410.m01.CDS01 [Anthostomella pinea]